MPNATDLIYTKITAADFMNIYKAPGNEAGGGGQSYIDVNTSMVPVDRWRAFFRGVAPVDMRGGPAWTVPIQSLGTNRVQQITIGQRRPASVSIRSQKLPGVSRQGNRVLAWNPSSGFPAPDLPPTSALDPAIGPLIENLTIYLIRDEDNRFWAGWIQRAAPDVGWTVPAGLRRLFGESDGYVRFDPPVPFDSNDTVWPFGRPADAYPGRPVAPRVRELDDGALPDEEGLLEELFDEDVSRRVAPEADVVRRVRRRNRRAVTLLKSLYRECQITGTRFVFPKRNGQPYLEAHHLIPLGEGGADAPHNLVVISAHIHRMLHHADVGPIPLGDIRNSELVIRINGEEFTIRWRPDHARMVEQAAAAAAAAAAVPSPPTDEP